MRGGDDHAAACEVAAHHVRRAGPARRRRAPRSARRAARSAAGRRPGARATAGAAARRKDRRRADRRAAPRPTALQVPALMSPRDPRNLVQNANFPPPSVTASGRPDGRDNAPARRLAFRPVAALERQPPGGNADEPGDHAKQGGFAGAVAPGNHQRFARRQPKLSRGTPRGRRGCRSGLRLEVRITAAGSVARWAYTRKTPNIFRIFGVNLGRIWRRARKDLISPHRATLRIEFGRKSRQSRKTSPCQQLSPNQRRSPGREWKQPNMTSLDSFQMLQDPQGRQQDLRLFQPSRLPRRTGSRAFRGCRSRMKVLLENLLRNEDGRTVTKEDIQAVAEWLKTKTSEREIAFRPARVLMQDFTGVPAVVDLAAMRDAMKPLGGDPEEDQSAGAGRSRHRPFGRGHFLRQQPARSRRTSRRNTGRTRSATSS